MPYKCVHCSKLYDDGASQVLSGCDNCSRKFFFYIRKEQLAKIEAQKTTEVELNEGEKHQMEQDVRDITGFEDEEAPIILDFESVRVLKPGKYLLDISKLFSRDKPRVYKLEDGKYIVDLVGKKK